MTDEQCIVTVGEPIGRWYLVDSTQLPGRQALPGDVVEIVDAGGRRGTARVQVLNIAKKKAYLVPSWHEAEGTEPG